MEQQIFTKKEVAVLIYEMLQYSDQVIDYIENENSSHDIDELLGLAIESCNKEQLQEGQSIYNDLVLISSIDAKSKEGKFVKNICKMRIANL